MICPKCNSDNVNVQVVSEVKKRGFFKILIYIILLCVPIIGWIALFMLIKGRKSKTVSYAVCQSCGKRWKP